VDDTEPVVSKCPGCGKDVTTYWMKNNTGCLSKPEEYVLVADWAFHPKCFDEMVEKHNPALTD